MTKSKKKSRKNSEEFHKSYPTSASYSAYGQPKPRVRQVATKNTAPYHIPHRTGTRSHHNLSTRDLRERKPERKMVYGATMSLLAPPPTAVALYSAHFLRRHALDQSFTLPLFPITLSAPIRVKPSRIRRPSAAGFGGPLLQDACATALVVGGAYGLVSTFDNLTRRNIIEQVTPLTPISVLKYTCMSVGVPITACLCLTE